MRLANRGRLLLRTPGPIPFGTCICSYVETILSLTCHVYGPFEFRTSLGTSILLIINLNYILHYSIYLPCIHSRLKIQRKNFYVACGDSKSKAWQTDRKADKQIDGQGDGQTDGRTDGRRSFPYEARLLADATRIPGGTTLRFLNTNQTLLCWIWDTRLKFLMALILYVYGLSKMYLIFM